MSLCTRRCHRPQTQGTKMIPLRQSVRRAASPSGLRSLSNPQAGSLYHIQKRKPPDAALSGGEGSSRSLTRAPRPTGANFLPPWIVRPLGAQCISAATALGPGPRGPNRCHLALMTLRECQGHRATTYIGCGPGTRPLQRELKPPPLPSLAASLFRAACCGRNFTNFSKFCGRGGTRRLRREQRQRHRNSPPRRFLRRREGLPALHPEAREEPRENRAGRSGGPTGRRRSPAHFWLARDANTLAVSSNEYLLRRP